MKNNLASQWKNLIISAKSDKDLNLGLEKLYLKHRPKKMEIILNSYCPNKCKHCLYNPKYYKYNKNLAPSVWLKYLNKMYYKFGYRNYIFCGRLLSLENIRLIKEFKKNHPDIIFGIIVTDNICPATKYAIIDLKPNWVDVSLDGTAKAHDNQRNRNGSFKATLSMLCQFREAGIKRINILSCATTLNINTIVPMIKQVNRLGFKNFFVGVITARKGWHLDLKLVPSAKQITKLARDLQAIIAKLDDAFIDFELYSAVYAKQLFNQWPKLVAQMKAVDDHLEYNENKGKNQFQIGYYPCSITCATHFIVNSNGDVVPPFVVRLAKIPTEFILGNLRNINNPKSVHQSFIKKFGFNIYRQEITAERNQLKNLLIN